MPVRTLEELDEAALTNVVGGGLLKNTDVSRQGWSFPGGAPMPKESAFSVRTNYGSCVDHKVQQLCTGTGPDAGRCMIDAANSCWRETKDKE
ncbi:MAG TPA: hypothetical protein VGL61_26800 [Kofleriaceae bacterium]